MKTKNISNKFLLALWIVVHLVIAVLFTVSVITKKGIQVNSDLLEMMPKDQKTKAISDVTKKMDSVSNRSFVIFACHEDFEKAKEAAVKASDILSEDFGKYGDNRIEDISLSSYSDMNEMMDFIHENRYNLLPKEFSEQLENKKKAEEYANWALAQIYSGFTMTPSEKIATDPFLLDEKAIDNLLAIYEKTNTGFVSKDDVLAREYNGKWYVMITGLLSEKGAALGDRHNGVELIYETCLPLEKDGVSFVFSGTPFHSQKSSVSAKTEISIISTVSIVAIVLILMLIFNNPLPIISSVLAIGISVFAGFGMTHFVFGKVHSIALLFGTSLIGSAIDYSLHYFINWKANAQLNSGTEIRRYLLKSLLIALVSTEICYIAFFFTKFAILSQMAMFLFFGILSSFLTVTCVFPLLPLPNREKREIRIPFENKINAIIKDGTISWIVKVGLIIVFSVIILFQYDEVRICNNISNIYQMQGRLKEDTILANSLLNGLERRNIIVSGKTEQDVLEKEESLKLFLEENGLNTLSTSDFIPSIKTQKKSRVSALLLKPYIDRQSKVLGLTEKDIREIDRDFENSKDEFLVPESRLPEALNSAINNLWIGKEGGEYYSIMMLQNFKDDSIIEEVNSNFDGIYLENKVAEINRQLDYLTKVVLITLSIIIFVLFILLIFIYGINNSLKIIMIPLASIFSILAVFSLCELKIELFCIVGILLVLGLGLDYVIYMLNSKKDRIELLAVSLSYLTTALSFGVLAFSSFVPVHIMGLSIFVGLTTSFIFALFA